MSDRFNLPFPGGTYLGGNLSQWGGFPFINTFVFGGFFPGTSFANIFPRGSTPIPRGIPLGGTSIPGRRHAFGSATIHGGTHSSFIPQPSGSTNIGGPQGIEIAETSPPSQYSFPHT
jgi:hypothetical protein